MTNRVDEICDLFKQTRWHDSKLLGLHLIGNTNNLEYDLRLDLDLIMGFSQGKVERIRSAALFSGCRILRADLDLLGILMCSRDIGAASCYPDAAALEKRESDKLKLFDLPQDENPLQQYIGFFIEMVPPGGELLIFARHFKVSSVNDKSL